MLNYIRSYYVKKLSKIISPYYVPFTTRKHQFSGRKKRPKSSENGRKIKKLAKLPAAMIGRKNGGR